jgi:hypothetical protein
MIELFNGFSHMSADLGAPLVAERSGQTIRRYKS